MNYLFISTLVVLGVYIISGNISRINERIKRIENKLEKISKHLNVPEPLINEELRQLVKEGKKIEAIKKIKESQGLSLRESKDYIDSL